MEAGIVGLPNVGKSTLFNALTAAGIPSENYPFCTIEPNVGVVPVPDDRLARIETHIATKKVIPAILRLVDIAGLVRGASDGQGLGNRFLSHIRNVDAIVQVVRCFSGEVVHVDGQLDPLRDIDTIESELLLADLQTAESAKEKAIRAARSGDRQAKARLALLETIESRLENGEPVRGFSPSDPDQQQALKELQFLSEKPILYVVNVDEDDLAGTGSLVQQVRGRAETNGAEVVVVCAKLESELAELDDADRQEMLESVGLREPALHSLARAAYATLGRQSFFTAGPKEIRAWTIPHGASAPQAAGAIHSDFQRGFIRVEVYSVDDLEHYQSEKAIRDAGKMRVEGKDYTMRDGDVCHFLFNV